MGQVSIRTLIIINFTLFYILQVVSSSFLHQCFGYKHCETQDHLLLSIPRPPLPSSLLQRRLALWFIQPRFRSTTLVYLWYSTFSWFLLIAEKFTFPEHAYSSNIQTQILMWSLISDYLLNICPSLEFDCYLLL